VDIVLERVDREASGSWWLFSRETLDSVPELYEETNLALADDVVPDFLKDPNRRYRSVSLASPRLRGCRSSFTS